MICFYILATIIASQLAIYLLSYKRIKKYCELSHQNCLTKLCAIIFPVIFANLEKCYANYLLSAATTKRDNLHPKYQNKNLKAVRKSTRKVKTFDFQSYFEITQNINEKQDRCVEITKIRSLVTLLDTILENYPQAVVMMSFMFLARKCANIRLLFQNNLGSLLGNDGSLLGNEEENSTCMPQSEDQIKKSNSNHDIVIATFAISTILTLVFVVRRIRYVHFEAACLACCNGPD